MNKSIIGVRAQKRTALDAVAVSGSTVDSQWYPHSLYLVRNHLDYECLSGAFCWSQRVSDREVFPPFKDAGQKASNLLRRCTGLLFAARYIFFSVSSI